MVRSAATPLTNVGIVTSATTAKTMSALRRRSVFLPAKDATNSASAITNPMMGT
jgi:hypothetical protein